MADKPDLFSKLFRKTKENLEKKDALTKPAGVPPTKAATPAAPMPPKRTDSKVKIPLTGGKLDAYRACPRRFQYQYIQKRTSIAEVSHYLAFDGSLHHTLRDFYREYNGKDHLKLDRLLALLEKNWDKRGYASPEAELEYKLAAEHGLRAYFQTWCQVPPRHVEVDYFFKVDLCGCEYSGRMDRVDKRPDGTYEIFDYKSGKPPAGGVEEIAGNLVLQLLFLAADVIWPGKVQRITHVYIKDGTVLTVLRDMSAVVKAKKEYLDIGESIYQSRFEAVRSQNCPYCDYQLECPTGRVPALSPSKLRAFLDCPRRYASMYVARTYAWQDEGPSFDLTLDRVLHDALTALYRDFKTGVHADPLGFLMAAFYEGIPKTLPEDLADMIKTTGRDALNTYFVQLYQAKASRLVNQAVSVLTDSFEYQVTFDRVDENPDGTKTLIDYRTGKRVADAGDLRLDAQVAAACFAAHRFWNGAVKELKYVYLRTGEEVVVEVDAFVLQRGQEILQEVSRKILEKRFEAVPGFSCPRCSEKSHCRLDAAMLSVGKLQTMRDCPKRYKYQYIDKAPGAEGEKPYLVLSQALHDSLRNLVATTRIPTIEQVLADFRKKTARTAAPFPEDMQKKGEAALLRFYQNLGGRLPKVKVLAERGRATVDGMQLTATFDRVDVLANGNYEIVDYKTSKKALSSNEKERDLAAVFTWMVAESLWAGKVERITFDYLLTGDKLHFSPTTSDVQRLKLAIEEFRDELEKGAFEGHRNPLCSYCDYMPQCDDAKRLLLSPSKINSFLSCGLKYKMNYIERVPKESRPTPHLNFDRSIHYALREFHQEFSGQKMAQSPFRYLLNKYWINEGYLDYEEEERFKSRAIGFLEQYYASLTGEEKVVFLETSATWKPGAFDVSVQIDRVDQLPDGKYEIIDYKTGKKVPDERVIHEDKSLLNMYLAASERWPGQVAKASYIFLSAGRKISLAPTAEHIEAHKRNLATIVQNIEKSSFEANKGALCNYCEFYGPCPEWKIKPFSMVDETMEVYRKRIRLSYSKMGLFENCPRSYKKLYIDRIPPKPQPFFSFGTCIHETFENVYDPDHPIEKPNLEELLNIYATTWKKHREGYKDEGTEQKYKDDGTRQVTMYYHRFIDDKPFQSAYSIEDYFEIPIGKYAVMTGFIDRIDRLPDGTFEILDYKTEPTNRTQDEVDHDKQLSIYYWACETSMGLKISKLSLFMLDHDCIISTTRQAADVEKVVKHVDGMAYRMIHEKEFAPRKNKYCKSCDHLHDCPLKEEVLADQSLISMKKF
jgi:RecB family exonuclease